MEVLENTRMKEGYGEDIIVKNGSRLNFCGAIMGTIRITGESSAIVNGEVFGDVIVMAGAMAEVNGIVHGTVFNYQGDVSIYGSINRVVTVRGNTYIDKKAVVRTVPCVNGVTGGHG